MKNSKQECITCGRKEHKHKMLKGVCPGCRKELYEMETTLDVLKVHKKDSAQAKKAFALAGLIFGLWILWGVMSGNIGV